MTTSSPLRPRAFLWPTRWPVRPVTKSILWLGRDRSVRSITTDKEQHLYLDGQDAKLIKGKRVLILDDVISTGESLKALEALVEKAGGIICGRMAILAEGDAKDRKDIIYLEPLPLFNADGTEK